MPCFIIDNIFRLVYNSLDFFGSIDRALSAKVPEGPKPNNSNFHGELDTISKLQTYIWITLRQFIQKTCFSRWIEKYEKVCKIYIETAPQENFRHLQNDSLKGWEEKSIRYIFHPWLHARLMVGNKWPRISIRIAGSCSPNRSHCWICMLCEKTIL